MFVPAYDVSGTLALPALSGATMLSFDTATVDLLASKLTGGTWTYLLLRQGSVVEVVKATLVSAGLVSVVRGRDNTTASAFSAGASVSYVFASEAVTDMLAEIPTVEDLSIVGEGGVTVDLLSPGVFSINIPTTPLAALEGSRINVLGTWPLQQIELVGGAYGCCPPT